MKKDYDVVIVGGGPGGLAVGCLLAKEGVSTAIIEKDPVLGGRYRSVDFHDCRVDSAIHFLVSLAG
ncbi:MAG: FAD/NAD(P)-binding protein, partial [Dehalococcoidia bacterium]